MFLQLIMKLDPFYCYLQFKTKNWGSGMIGVKKSKIVAKNTQNLVDLGLLKNVIIQNTVLKKRHKNFKRRILTKIEY